MPTRRILGPFNRVEGDLEVQVDIDDGRVSGAWVNSPLYRGFEQILIGKDPRDALVITPRICGICSVSQSVAAAQALAHAQGIEPTPNGRLATNLILACENVADHLSHFYLFFMPDFARNYYASHPWHPGTVARFAAQKGTASRDMLPARSEWMHITGLLAGKWPHSLALQPGGTTRALEPREKLRLQSIIAGFRRFLEATLFDGRLEDIAALRNNADLTAWADQHTRGDFAWFIRIASALDLSTLGRAGDRFLSYGAYTTGEHGTPYAFKSGIWFDGRREAFDQHEITEDISHSWMHAQRTPKHPYDGSTLPDADIAEAYSWCKAPRYRDEVFEVGAIARQLNDGHPLIVDLVGNGGGNVFSRVIARLLELARIVPLMETWAKAITIGETFCAHGKLPKDGEGVGLVEAARGSLGHWLQIKHGRILNYQIVAPTTWNFSPRDQNDVPGALEQALLGTPVGADGKQTVAIQHIVRSFDPCMVCTVH